ncbi:glycosyltransferase family 4 protein [Streptomyces anulatus]|uniref:glycosyltransferase family 4 protein n=1 Tax=Streptomyces anulatus TaxID=1892 RepID=UPI003441742C
MTTVLALTDSTEDIQHFCPAGSTFLFTIRLLPAEEHTYEHFEEIYRTLKESCDLATVDVVVAEYVESLPLLYFMRRDGFDCPALMIPHNNPYPLHILLYFLLVSAYRNPADLVICGSANAQRAYERLTGLPARNICTFGIADTYRPLAKDACRDQLGLPRDRTVLLYTGRFMNDKGIAHLLSAYDVLRRENPEMLLVLSATHIDPPYYNQLAAQLEGTVLFHRLEREQTALLYNAADLFVSCATSVFETYGKSPLEALACGVPVVVPRWDGFPYYINDENGALAAVEYLTEPVDPDANPYEFARVDEADFVESCRRVLGRPGPLTYKVPSWARYENTMRTLPTLIEEMGRYPRPTPLSADTPRPLDPGNRPKSVSALLDHYGLEDARTLLAQADRLGLLDQSDPGEPPLLRDLHNELFGLMEKESERVQESH